MPFQSEKQRRYMHANLPDIAKRWERDYSNGGNVELNSLPEYYMPFPAAQGGRIGFDEGTEIPEKFLEDLERKKYYKLLEKYRRWKEEYDRKIDQAPTQEAAHGGLIPSHEAGIYGLAEGGQLVKPGPGRPGYNGQGDYTPDRSTPSTGGGPPGGGDPGMTYTAPTVSTTAASEDAYGTPETTTTSTTDDKGGGYTDRIIDLAERKRREDLRNIVAQGEKTETWEKEQQWSKPNKFWSFIKNAALVMIPALLPAKLATGWKVGKLGFDYKAGKLDHYLPANFKSTGKYAKDIGNTLQQNAEKRKTDKAEQDLINVLPEGHPERIQLEGLKKETITTERDNGQIQETGTSITIDAEEVNDAKAQLLRKYQEMNEASRLAWLRQQQQQEDRSKQMASWRMMMKPYFTGAAQGGRVPAGYNTGGLSNLFRLKNI